MPKDCSRRPKIHITTMKNHECNTMLEWSLGKTYFFRLFFSNLKSKNTLYKIQEKDSITYALFRIEGTSE